MLRPLLGPINRLMLLTACLVTLVCLTRPAAGAERYFAFVFSSQAVPKLPRFTHVWATMVKVGKLELPCDQRTFQVDTISWFPATLKVHTLRLHPETGVNLGLHETIARVHQQHQHVSVWGPFEVPEFMYCEFMTQKARLESGRILYQAIDSLSCPENVSDCIHSLTDMDRQNRRSAYPLSRFGDDAAAEFVNVIKRRGQFVASDESIEFAYQALGISCGSITRRACEPTKHVLFGR